MAEELITCQYCGRKIPANALYCQYCGSRQDRLMAESESKRLEIASQSVQSSESTQAESSAISSETVPTAEQIYERNLRRYDLQKHTFNQVDAPEPIAYKELPKSTWQEATKRYFQNLFVVKGRTSQADFWWAQLTMWLISFVFVFISAVMLSISAVDPANNVGSFDIGGTVLTAKSFLLTRYVLFFTLAANLKRLMNIGATVRRLHDTDKSAWYLAFYLLPLVGEIVILVLTILPGARHENIYGAVTRTTVIPGTEKNDRY